MTKAIFLDRDGVINNGDLYYTYQQKDFIFNPDIFESLKTLYKAGFLLIVISNQGGISKKQYTYQDVNTLHLYMTEQFKKQGILIHQVYYCPHHDSIEQCICRKPNSAMIEKAIARFGIDPRKSYLIGDSERDIEAAKKVGIRGIKIAKNTSILDLCVRIAKKQ